MGLKSFSGIPKPGRPSVTSVDLSRIGLEGSLKFRSPRVADFFPRAELKNQAMRFYPELVDADPAHMTQFLMLVQCYVPEPDEEEKPMQVFGGLMKSSPELYLSLIGLFGEAFPMSLAEAKERAGND